MDLEQRRLREPVAKTAQLLSLLMLSSMATGCMWWEDEEVTEEERGAFEFDQQVPITTRYHYPGTVAEPVSYTHLTLPTLCSV